ncbi:MAG: hypothetical protein EOP92_11960 [Lysobacteraceae bacterium]|nr:MAG: hypothetical protein EOP92_11960 [Xanthomonadaceae bacterium]
MATLEVDRSAQSANAGGSASQVRRATIAAIERRIAELEVERLQLEAQYTSRWPEIRAVELQLGQLRARLAQLTRSPVIRQGSDILAETPAGNPFQSR